MDGSTDHEISTRVQVTFVSRNNCFNSNFFLLLTIEFLTIDFQKHVTIFSINVMNDQRDQRFMYHMYVCVLKLHKSDSCN